MNSAQSQRSSVDSIIQLEEVTIENKKNQEKKISIKTKGKKNSTFSVQKSSIFVSRINNIPNGKIFSIKFYFNNRKNTKFYKNNFRLKLFRVNSENKPGEEILNEKINFSINANHKGEIELNISQLDLVNLTELFLGLELLNQNNDLGFSIDCITAKNAFTYYKSNSTDHWIKLPNMKIRTELIVLN